MSFQRNGCYFPMFFHVINDKSNHGEVKPSGRRVEVKGQFIFVLEDNMKLEVIQVDCDGVRFAIFRHFLIPKISLKRQGILPGPKVIKKM